MYQIDVFFREDSYTCECKGGTYNPDAYKNLTHFIPPCTGASNSTALAVNCAKPHSVWHTTVARRPLEYLFCLPLLFMAVVLAMEYGRLIFEQLAERFSTKAKQQATALQSAARRHVDDNVDEEIAVSNSTSHRYLM